MTEEALMPCPFCDAPPPTSTVHGGSNEQTGYNVQVIIQCKTCGAQILERSKEGPGGWCNEKTALVIERAVRRWNARDMVNVSHRAGYEAASVEAAKAGRHLLAYDVFMRGK